MSSDASGALGYGAVFQGHRFSVHGSQNRSLSPSSARTFSPLSWQPTSGVFLWAFKRVNFLSDNHSVVAILRSDTSRAPAIMSLVRYLSLLKARHSSSFTETPARGKSSPINPCHFQFQRFRRLAPHADSIPTQIPHQLVSDKCHLYLNQGLAPSTIKVYASAKRRFLDFYAQENSLPVLGSALPSSEDVLIRFCFHLADTLHCSSITFQQSDPFSSGRVCLLHWLVLLWLQRVCGVAGYQTSPRLKWASASFSLLTLCQIFVL